LGGCWVADAAACLKSDECSYICISHICCLSPNHNTYRSLPTPAGRSTARGTLPKREGGGWAVGATYTTTAVKISTGHTHTHTDREQHPRHRHTDIRQNPNHHVCLPSIVVRVDCCRRGNLVYRGAPWTSTNSSFTLHTLAFTRYCHYQYLMMHDLNREGRGEVIHCAKVAP